MSGRLVFVVAVFLSLWTGTPSAQQENRVALVIGNAAYVHAEPLRNPVNDAREMARVLRAAGFEVIIRENASRRVLTEALGEFAAKLTPGGVGLFYFAGHGFQVRGSNYLVPVDAALNSEYDVKYETLDINDVMIRLEEARARLSLVILDACRDNPFARRFRSTSRGLAQTDAPRGTVIAYATAPGDTAADGDGENGLYTGELLKAIATPGLKLEDVFKRTIDGVARASGNKQTPWLSSSFRGEFYFHPVAAPSAGHRTDDPVPRPRPVPAPPSTPPEMLELAAWNAVANSTNPALFELFLKRFPDGVYADFARAKLEELKTAAVLEERRRSTAAAEAARRRAAADDARRKAETEEARRAAVEEAKRRAADEDARRRATADDEKKSVEAVEAALKLADVDRKRIQAGLTARGFDTMGADGVFGPRTRQMIANFQRSRSEPPTGYLTATQAALLSREGQSALAKLEDERRKADEERRKAEAERQKAEAERQRIAPPSPPQQQAATPAPVAPGARDGSWRIMESCLEVTFTTFLVKGARVSAYVAVLDTSRGLGRTTVPLNGSLTPDGSFTLAYSDSLSVSGNVSANAIVGTVFLPKIGKRCALAGRR